VQTCHLPDANLQLSMRFSKILRHNAVKHKATYSIIPIKMQKHQTPRRKIQACNRPRT